MKSYDFEYDSLRLSDKGFVICTFDGYGVETVSNGSVISFNTVPTLNGMKHELTSSTYEDCLTATLQICKNPCAAHDLEEISLEDMRDIMRWLNRKNFHKFKLLGDDEYLNIYFEASFNVSKIEINGVLYGFELEMFTNTPFGLHEPVIINIDSEESQTHSIFSKSDEEGYIYPNMEITMKSGGDLEIYNAMEDRTMIIKNCTSGEVINIDYPIITSSVSSHKIQNDFNWKFFRIATEFKNKHNEVTISLPCEIKMQYSPVVKVGV